MKNSNINYLIFKHQTPIHISFAPEICRPRITTVNNETTRNGPVHCNQNLCNIHLQSKDRSELFPSEEKFTTVDFKRFNNTRQETIGPLRKKLGRAACKGNEDERKEVLIPPSLSQIPFL